MSKIGNKSIQIPSGVTVSENSGAYVVKGPKGELTVPMFENISVNQNEGLLTVTRTAEDKQTRAYHGLVRSLLNNNIEGTSKGFSKTLLLQGVGFRAVKKGQKLVLSLGFSHDVEVDQPSDVNIEVPEATKLILSGIDKQRVGQVAAQIRSYRPPEPYKGKGVRYEDEYVRRKAGKAGKK
jgi:large subunit ribosomal protein L6